jgi:hypothetical protein
LRGEFGSVTFATDEVTRLLVVEIQPAAAAAGPMTRHGLEKRRMMPRMSSERPAAQRYC